MKSIPSATLAYRQSRAGTMVRNLLWITAKQWSDGSAVTAGFWNGDDTTTVTIGGANRLYYGAGSIIGIEPLRYTSGLLVQMQHVQLNAIVPEVEQELRGYDTRIAPIEIHQVDLDPATGDMIDVPFRVFKGWIDQLDLKRAPEGGTYIGDMTLANSTRSLTTPLTLRKSNAALQARSPGDTFRRDAAVAMAIPFNWGGQSAATPNATPVSSTADASSSTGAKNPLFYGP